LDFNRCHEVGFDLKEIKVAYQKGTLIYEGKAKRLFSVAAHDELIWQEFKDSLTAFNAQKKGSFADKGAINRDITSIVFRFLMKRKIETHWVADVGTSEQITKRLDMIPLEVVVRNVLAGSTAKKFAIDEGTPLEQPLTEFYFKNDALQDPFVSDEQAMMLKAVHSKAELEELKRQALAINQALKELFSAIGIRLIDFKIEFGRDLKNKRILLADEVSPDSCRLWDAVTGEKMDKDRFRRDLGSVRESYSEVREKLMQTWEKQL